MTTLAIILTLYGHDVDQARFQTRTFVRSWIAWGLADERIPTRDLSLSNRLEWSLATTQAVMTHAKIRGRYRYGPELLVAISTRESGLDPDAVLPGCPRREPRPRFCNTDGRPDVGLCQLRVGPTWSRVTMETARDPATNLMECARQISIHWVAHQNRGCERQGWPDRWPERGAHDDHLWLQHHNPGNRRHGYKVKRLWHSIKRGVDTEVWRWKRKWTRLIRGET